MFRHLDADEIDAKLSMSDMIDAVANAVVTASAGGFEQPPRLVLDGGRLLVMAAVQSSSRDAVVKTLTVRLDRDGPPIEGTLQWVDGRSGRPTFTADASRVTALRTGAVAGVATDLLAARGAARLAVLGSGVQAAAQVDAMCAVRPIESISVYSPTVANAQDFAANLRRNRPSLHVVAAASADDAVRGADIVCCATSAAEPVFSYAALRSDAHVNAIGSYQRAMAELPTELLLHAALVVVDDLAGCFEESGEIAAALALGLNRRAIVELGSLVRSAPKPGGLTVFKSVGCAILDWAVGAALAKRLDAPNGRFPNPNDQPATLGVNL